MVVAARRSRTADTGWTQSHPRKGFFTDSSICIGCKACEVACKEWNGVPEDGLDLLGSSYDDSFGLGASTWRHVKFIEQTRPAAAAPVSLGMPGAGPPGAGGAAGPVTEFRWLMESDVCKNCIHAGIALLGGISEHPFGILAPPNRAAGRQASPAAFVNQNTFMLGLWPGRLRPAGRSGRPRR